MTAIPESVARILDELSSSAGDFRSARTMPSEVYTSQEFFEFEWDSIFTKEWLCLGHVSQVPEPGDYYSLTVGREPLIVTRGLDGEVRVLSAICQHRGYPILDNGETGNAKRLRCPYHYWSYDLDGQLASAPEMSQTCPLDQLKAETSLPKLKTEIWYGFIFATMNHAAKPLGPTLKKLEPEVKAFDTERMTVVRTLDFPGLPWNWKGMHENGLEPYHTMFVHKGFHDTAPASKATFVDWDDEDGQVMHPTGYLSMDAGFAPGGVPLLPIIPGLDDERRSRITFASIPPIGFFAFSPDQVFIFLVLPEGVDSLTLRATWLFPEESIKSPHFQWGLDIQNHINGVINEQDFVTNTRMQRGQRSRYVKRGRYSHQEGTLPQFNNWLIKRYRAAADLVAADPAADGAASTAHTGR
jgi:phenylpropionate dioxygenase-like ring-hydroxylating dioxygenase large terminal subunit